MSLFFIFFFSFSFGLFSLWFFSCWRLVKIAYNLRETRQTSTKIDSQWGRAQKNMKNDFWRREIEWKKTHTPNNHLLFFCTNFFLSVFPHFQIICESLVTYFQLKCLVSVYIFRLSLSFSISHIFKYSFHLHQTHFATFFTLIVSLIFCYNSFRYFLLVLPRIFLDNFIFHRAFKLLLVHVQKHRIY